MKTVRLAIMSVFSFAALSIPALAQAEAKASQAEAARQFPDLAKAGSEFNKAFLAKLQAAKAAQDRTLSRTDWPMILATAVATDLGVKSTVTPAVDPNAKPATEDDPDAATPGRVGALKFANGDVMQKAEIQSVTADGVVVKYNGKVTKFWWNYFAANERARLERAQRLVDADAETTKRIEKSAFGAIFEPFSFYAKTTTGHIQPYRKVEIGAFENQGLNRIPKPVWIEDGDSFVGVLDEPMPKNVGRNQGQVGILYPIGHTGDTGRDPLFTTSLERAKQYYAQNPEALAELARRDAR